MIGHLQVNKVRQAVPMFDLIHSVDNRKLLDEIKKVAHKAHKIRIVASQRGSKASKTGMTVEEFQKHETMQKTLPHVRVRGLDVWLRHFFDDQRGYVNLPRSKRLV